MLWMFSKKIDLKASPFIWRPCINLTPNLFPEEFEKYFEISLLNENKVNEKSQ